jgi:hypothetical protein
MEHKAIELADSFTPRSKEVPDEFAYYRSFPPAVNTKDPTATLPIQPPHSPPPLPKVLVHPLLSTLSIIYANQQCLYTPVPRNA